jgi:hypothetical protein
VRDLKLVNSRILYVGAGCGLVLECKIFVIFDARLVATQKAEEALEDGDQPKRRQCRGLRSSKRIDDLFFLLESLQILQWISDDVWLEEPTMAGASYSVSRNITGGP